MEDTHGVLERVHRQSRRSLNPYYNGRYSWSFLYVNNYHPHRQVLILIIMEDTHGVKA